MEEIVYNPIIDKKPLGPVKENTKITFDLRIKCSFLVSKVVLVMRYEKDNETQYIECNLSNYETNYFVYSCSIKLNKIGLYWYHFEIATTKGMLYGTKNNRYLASLHGNEEFPLTVIKKEIEPAKECLGGIIYHIFVDRFNKVGNPKVRDGFVYRDDWGGVITKNTTDRTLLNYEVFGGNLKGVIEKLDYLKSIGVSIIYLSPIFMAPSNHKYDTSNYEIVDPMFGDNDILKELIDKAKEKGIGIILDGVFNHMGSDSIYFNKEKKFNSVGAYNSKNSKYYNWFNFESWPDKYRCWWGITTLPSVNQSNKELQDYIAYIIKKYMSMGLLGFRLDVVDEIHHELLTKICNSIYEVKKDALVIGEVWEDASIKIAYGFRRGYFLGEELNSVMNYPLKEALIDYVLNRNCDQFFYVYEMIENNYPEFVKHSLMNLIDSHDTRRILSILKEKENYLSLLKIITGLQFTFYGLPSIFYGDEVGVEEDPPDFSRKCYPWGKENKEILEWYKMLSKIRKHKVFKNGKMKIIKASDGILVFKRIDKSEEILIISNLNDDTFVYNTDSTYKSLITNQLKEKIIIKHGDIDIFIKVKK